MPKDVRAYPLEISFDAHSWEPSEFDFLPWFDWEVGFNSAPMPSTLLSLCFSWLACGDEGAGGAWAANPLGVFKWIA